MILPPKFMRNESVFFQRLLAIMDGAAETVEICDDIMETLFWEGCFCMSSWLWLHPGSTSMVVFATEDMPESRKSLSCLSLFLTFFLATVVPIHVGQVPQIKVEKKRIAAAIIWLVNRLSGMFVVLESMTASMLFKTDDDESKRR